MTNYFLSKWMAITLQSLCAVLMLSTLSLFVQSASPSTNISFPVFESLNDFITLGEVRYNPDKLSIATKPSGFNRHAGLNFVKETYKQKVRMKERASGPVASCTTSFTFSITPQDQSTNRSGSLSPIVGFVFSFNSFTISTLFTGPENAYPGVLKRMKFLAVEFDNYNYFDEDPSDNHIGVDINDVKSRCAYNLCEGNTSSCSFPWTGHTYTAWIDYNASSQSLEVWFANGSLREGVTQPAGSGFITISGLDLTDLFDDVMYVGFSGEAGPFSDTHEILSWNFANSFPAPTHSRIYLFKRVITICTAACGVAIIFLGCHWRRQAHKEKLSELGLTGLRRFSFRELKKATRNFNESCLLGKGGSGTVYKGSVAGVVVAVKRFNHDSEQIQGEFLAELLSISQLRHRNLVQLQGWCHEDGKFLLVFESMSNGSLDEWLFPSRRRRPPSVLPWELRFSVMAGVAAAVEYLHEEWVWCVLHRDIKCSNVMMDAEFNPHLGDFGFARLIDHEKLEKTTMMAGKFRCMAPEMQYTGKATKESDVYSFGILLLEVVCGGELLICRLKIRTKISC